MTTSKKEKKKQIKVINEQLINKEEQVGATIQQFSNATDALMPELEELVKKNPNRLIGCGG
ncbi:MAG TPA: hypothetical protein PK431_14385 [Chitinophagales bacterium]|nr:hypothetical protein [Chitinophagales bacterium]